MPGERYDPPELAYRNKPLDTGIEVGDIWEWTDAAFTPRSKFARTVRIMILDIFSDGHPLGDGMKIWIMESNDHRDVPFDTWNKRVLLEVTGWKLISRLQGPEEVL